ncbi:MAG: chorismate synthase, partial [Candidatus Omnitrophica bacterium]|nr:chorismate synthase [Candidatus Omnitrophota bacterium]
NLVTKRREKAIVERSDACAIVALSVIAESMCALTISELFLEKFGCDALSEIKANYRNYLNACNSI